MTITTSASTPGSDSYQPGTDAFHEQERRLRALALGTAPGPARLTPTARHACVAACHRNHQLHLGVEVYRPGQEELGRAEGARVSLCWAQFGKHFYFDGSSEGMQVRSRCAVPWSGHRRRLAISGPVFTCDAPGAHDPSGLVLAPATLSPFQRKGTLVGPLSFVDSACKACAEATFGSYHVVDGVATITAFQRRAILKDGLVRIFYPLAFAGAKCCSCSESLTAPEGVGAKVPQAPVEAGWARYHPFGYRCVERHLLTEATRYADEVPPPLLPPPKDS